MRFYPDQEHGFQLTKMLNEGLELGDNFRGAFLEITTAGGVQEVQHNLGYTPIGFLLILKNGEGDIWSARVEEWNSVSLFLVSNVPNLVVRLFVM
jgi:hypothetical protein